MNDGNENLHPFKEVIRISSANDFGILKLNPVADIIFPIKLIALSITGGMIILEALFAFTVLY
jgi:hypothetical protein